MLTDFVGFVRNGGLVGWRAGSELNLDGDGIKGSFARQYDLIMRGKTGNIEKARFDLRRKDINAANDQHVVVTTGHAHDAGVSPAADAWFVDEGRDVARAIADHRQRFLC